jgi:DNA-directed RNA polymerase sigma subunit (sigma70/sigma32)
MSDGFKVKINFYLTHPNEDLQKLNDEERAIIEMRLGLGRYIKRHTLKEISQILVQKSTHSWARDKVNKILKKVRYQIKNDQD